MPRSSFPLTLFPLFSSHSNTPDLSMIGNLHVCFVVRQAVRNTLRTGNCSGTETAQPLRAMTSLFQARHPRQISPSGGDGCFPGRACLVGERGAATWHVHARRGIACIAPSQSDCQSLRNGRISRFLTKDKSAHAEFTASSAWSHGISHCRGSHHLITSPTNLGLDLMHPGAHMRAML